MTIKRYERDDPAGNASHDQKHAAAMEELRKASGGNWLLLTADIIDDDHMSVRLMGGGTADDRTTRAFLAGGIKALVVSMQELDEQSPS